ncbi:MAG: YdcF family protein [Candidatus Nitrospinota bacterium M3_3B_026]
MKKLYRRLRALFAIIGIFGAAAAAAPFAGLPQKGLDWLSSAPYSADCGYILLLPAGPIPSPAMLMRAYKAAEEAGRSPAAKVVISLKTDPPLRGSTIWTIRKELAARGVAADRIILETKARSTYEHARFIKEAGIGDPAVDSYLVVTSPSHVRRSVMTFERAGFKNLYAAPASAGKDDTDLGGGLFIRYGYWSALQLEIEVVRELVAIGWYRLTGRA